MIEVVVEYKDKDEKKNEDENEEKDKNEDRKKKKMADRGLDRRRREGKNGREGEDKGFTFSLAALFIAIALITSCMALQSIPAPTLARPYADPSVRSQAVKSLLLGAAQAAAASGNASSAGSYVNAVLSYQSVASALGLQGGPGALPPSGTGYSPPSPSSSSSIPGSFVKAANGTGSTSTITVTGVPSGGTAAVTDRNFNIIALGTSSSSSTPLTLNLGTPASVPQGWVVVYTPDSPAWYYSGTISPSYTYTLGQDFKITAASWSPPPGFQQVFIYGAPQLSLIQIYSGTALKASAVKDLMSAYAALTPAGMPFAGSMAVTGAVAWINTDIKGGDVYAYTYAS